MTIDGWIARVAERDPARAALIFGGETISYGAMARKIAARAGELAGAGVARGDRVGWYGLNHAEVFVLLFACARLGAMLVPLNWRLAQSEVAEIVANCAPVLVIHDTRFAEAARALPGIRAVHVDAEIAPPGEVPQGAEEGDAILLVYTSGSTGRPKGVVLTQRALIANAKMSVAAHDLSAASKVLNVLPLFHVGGLNILPTPAFSVGATVVLHQGFEPGEMVQALAQASHAITVPTVLQALIAHPDWAASDLSALHSISIGSTDVPVGLIRGVQARGVPVLQIYGATETAPLAIYQTRDIAFDTVGSLGRAGCGCDIRLVRDGQDADQGEIWVRGDNVLREYWRDGDATAQALQDGWFRTGDVARRDDKGLYWFTDRIKHVIISGGENIYPAEIERVLRENPAIAEVAVVGRPDPRWGEVPVAVVVAAQAITAHQVLDPLRERIARYKQPKDVVFVKALPRNAMGKVVASDVRAMIAGAPGGWNCRNNRRHT